MGSLSTYTLNFSAQIAAIGIQVSYAAMVAAAEQETYKKRSAMVDTISQQVQDRADEKHALWRDSYKDCEIAYIREVCADEPGVLDYGTVRQKVDSAYRPAFRRNIAAARECITDSCAPVSCAAVRTLNVRQAMATAWGLEGALRAGEDEHRLLAAQSNERKFWVVNSGNGHFGNTAGGSLAAATIYGRLAANAGDSSNGALAFIGASLRGLTTAVQQEPERRPHVVPRPDGGARSTPARTVAPIDSAPDPYDAKLYRPAPTQSTAAELPPGPDPYDTRFGRHIMTEEPEPQQRPSPNQNPNFLDIPQELLLRGPLYEPEVPK